MTGLLLLLAIGLTILWIAAVASTAWMLSHPPRRTYGSAVARAKPGDPSELDQPRKFESWSFMSRGMRLPVWTIRGDLPPSGGPTIVLTHGWADSRIGALARIAALAPVSSWIIAWDLPGHGEAPGRCSLGIEELDHLRALIDKTFIHTIENSSPLILYGWSLGAGLSIAAAADVRGVYAVIAESPYRLPETPARNVLRARGLPWRATLRPAIATIGAFSGDPAFRGFDRAALAPRVRCPLLVLHGEADVVCPVDDGCAIAAAAPRGTLAIIQGAGHNDLWTDARFSVPATDAVRSFLSSAAPPTLHREHRDPAQPDG